MLQAIWQANRPFIIRVAAGLAVFLILMNIAIRSQAEGKDKTVKATNALGGLSDKLQRMDGSHKKHQQSAKALEGQVDQLLDQLSLHRRAEIEPPAQGDTSIDFQRRKGEIWSGFGDRAKRINLRFPQLDDINFNTGKDLTEEEWGDRYDQLEVLRRLLDAAISSQIDRIVSVTPSPLESEMIEEDVELALHRIKLGIKIEATYPELLTFVRRYHFFLPLSVS